MILKLGSKGLDVATLQRKLKAAGYDPGAIDGDYGRKTFEAVLEFQVDRPQIEDDGIAGPMTLSALDAAQLQPGLPPTPKPPVELVPCNATTRTAFLALVNAIVKLPVKYGPGRGLFVNGKFVVTCGPGKLGSKSWANFLGKPYASFHCSSFTNLILAWLLRFNERFTHAGNMADLITELMVQDDSLHPIYEEENGQKRKIGEYRGYEQYTSPIVPDGSASKRYGVSGIVDARELLARRHSLPSFIVCGQSTKRSGKWLWWHHTVLFFVDHDDGSKLYRIAADGYRDTKRGYSAQAMKWQEITDANVGWLDGCIYRAFGVDTTDGSYGDQSKPIAPIAFEPA